MNPEKAAAKLRPLMPKVVDHWMMVRRIADPDLKNLIEKQIISTAYKKLGDLDSRILLSLPPESQCSGSIDLGTVLYDKPKWPAGISKSELLQNMGIYGRSGAGKSNLCYHLIRQLDHHRIPFLFFDQKRNLRDLLFSLKNKVNVYTPGRSLLKFSFNPFITPPGLEHPVYIGQLVNVMANAFTLGQGAQSILQKAITACYDGGNHAPTAEEIICQIENTEAKERVRGWKISALRAMESLRFSNIAADPASQEEMTRKLIHENTVIELDGLCAQARSFLVPIIYQWIFQVKLICQSREKLELVIVTDEAHISFGKQQSRSSETLLERLLRMTRELGIANILLDQTPSLISKVVLANCYTNIFLNLSSVADQTLAASVCLLDTEDRRFFSSLPVGQAICKLQARCPQAFLIEVPLVQFPKGSVNDAQLVRYSAVTQMKSTGSGQKTSLPTYFGQVPQVPTLLNSPLDDDSFRLLSDIQHDPQDGVKIRYQRLGLSIGKGNRLKQQLLDGGWLRSQTIDLGQTRKVLLALTKQAKEILGIKNIPPEHGSLVHHYWQNWYAQRFRERGYQVSLETPRPSGSIDVVAQKNNLKIAIEIETGKSHYIRNVQQNLLAGYNTVLVVATDKNAHERIEKDLATAGLLIPGKIQLILRGDVTVHP